MNLKEYGMKNLGGVVCAVVVVFGILVACSVVPASPPVVGCLIAALGASKFLK